jgi:membrane protein implicated in regulation of membrane protease activity
MEQFLVEYAWIIWLGLILLFVVLEMFTLDLTALILAIGSAGGLVAGLFGAEFWVQIVVAAVVTIALLFVRPPLKRMLFRSGDQTLSNVEALIGLTGVAMGDVRAVAGGQVKLSNGETWTARSTGTTIPEGGLVTVTTIEGATAVVSPAE